MRCAILALLVLATLAGAEPPLSGTPLRWEAGRVPLSEALARLAAGGNRVWLAEGIDDAVEAELPAVDGLWWDGVIALCQAFTLRPDEGEAAEEQLDLTGIPVPIGHGTLVLTRGQPPGLQAVGGLLAMAEADSTVRLQLRAEPRVARGTLAWARADVATVEPAVGLTLEMVEPGENAPAATTWRPSRPVPAASRLVVAVQAATVARWTTRGQLRVGETIQLQANGQTIKAVLLVDPAVTTWEGQTLPERRPLVAISGPIAVLQRAQHRLHQGETELPTRGGGAHSDDNGNTVMYRYLRAAPEGLVDLDLEGRTLTTAQRLELRLGLPTVPPNAETTPPEVPKRLAWEAGQAPLSQWLGRLSATGNPVLPEVGVDTNAPVSLPAVRGGFWDGIQALSASTGLIPALSSETALAGGAVRLVRRPRLASAVCGPLLIIATRIASEPGVFAVNLSAALEPRLPEDGFAPPGFSWASWATDEQGRIHPVLNEATTEPRRGVPPAEASTVLSIRLAAGGARQLVLDGLVTLPRVRLWRATADLAVNEGSEVLLGGNAVELTALSAPTRVGNNQWGPGLLLRGLRGVAGVRFSLTTPDGQPLEHPGEANRLGNGPFARSWLGWSRIPAQGRLNAEIAARAALPALVLPVRLVLPVPDGL